MCLSCQYRPTEIIGPTTVVQILIRKCGVICSRRMPIFNNGMDRLEYRILLIILETQM